MLLLGEQFNLVLLKVRTGNLWGGCLRWKFLLWWGVVVGSVLGWISLTLHTGPTLFRVSPGASGGKQGFAHVAPVADPCPPAAGGRWGSHGCCSPPACKPVYLCTEQERVSLWTLPRVLNCTERRFGVCLQLKWRDFPWTWCFLRYLVQLSCGFSSSCVFFF